MTIQNLQIVIDNEVDAAYIQLRPAGHGGATTQLVVDDDKLKGEVILDLDQEGRLLGIELIGYVSLVTGGVTGPGTAEPSTNGPSPAEPGTDD